MVSARSPKSGPAMPARRSMVSEAASYRYTTLELAEATGYSAATVAASAAPTGARPRFANVGLRKMAARLSARAGDTPTQASSAHAPMWTRRAISRDRSSWIGRSTTNRRPAGHRVDNDGPEALDSYRADEVVQMTHAIPAGAAPDPTGCDVSGVRSDATGTGVPPIAESAPQPGWHRMLFRSVTPGVVYRLAWWRRSDPGGSSRMSIVGLGRASAELRYSGPDAARTDCLRRQRWALQVVARCG